MRVCWARASFLIPLESLLNRKLLLSPKSGKRLSFLKVNDGINIDETLEKTPPVSRKKIHRMDSDGEHRWTARDRTVVTKMEHHLDRSESLEVDIEELEHHLLGPDELDFDIRRIALNSRGEQQQKPFHTFGQKEISEFLVAR